MRSLKRFVSLVTIITLFLILLPSTIGFATENPEKIDAAGFMEQLGIITDKTDVLYGQNVTRADFAEYLAKLLKIGYAQSNEDFGRYFIDVTNYDYAAGSINALVEAGIISVGESREFRPADYITLDEAVKMTVCAVGFKPMAEARGGFPIGYNKVAKQQEMLDGVNQNANEITLNDATRLLFNTLITPTYTVTSVLTDDDGEYDFVYSAKGGETLLESVYFMKCVRGVLTGADGIDIWQGGDSSETSIVLGGNLYRTEKATDYVRFIGREVYGILEIKSNSVFSVFIPFDTVESVTEIDVEDFVSYTKDKVSYYNNDGSKVVDTDISGAILLYNGAVPKRNIKELMNDLTDGSILFIDYNNDRKCDAVMVENYESYVLKYYDSTTETLLFKNNNSSIELGKFEYVTIINENGEYVNADELSANDIISIAKTENGERIKAVVGGNVAEGIVSGKHNSGGKVSYKIGDGEYEVSSHYLKEINDSISNGIGVIGYIDIFGKLVYMENKDGSDYVTAYLMDVILDYDGLSKSVKFYMYTDNSKFERISSAQNIVIDGIKYKNDEKALMAVPECIISGDDISITPQIIRYKLNSNGEISRIDTYNQGAEAEESSLKRVLDQSKDIMKLNYRIGKNLVMSDNTKVFHVPLDEELASADENDFVIARQNSINSRYSFKFECYKLCGDNEYVDVVVYRRKPNDTEQNDWWNSNMFLVKEVSECVDGNMEKYYKISGLMNGANSTLDVYEEDLYKENDIKPDAIFEGDLIRFRKNFAGRVHDLELLYSPRGFDFSNWKNYNDTTSLFDPTYDQHFQLSFGYVSESTEHNVGWGYKSGTQTDEMIDMSSVNCMFYDTTARDGNKIYTGKSSAVRSYEFFGEKCDKIVAQFKNGNVSSVVIYR